MEASYGTIGVPVLEYDNRTSVPKTLIKHDISLLLRGQEYRPARAGRLVQRRLEWGHGKVEL